jgi:hypothetical protein
MPTDADTDITIADFADTIDGIPFEDRLLADACTPINEHRKALFALRREVMNMTTRDLARHLRAYSLAYVTACADSLRYARSIAIMSSEMHDREIARPLPVSPKTTPEAPGTHVKKAEQRELGRLYKISLPPSAWPSKITRSTDPFGFVRNVKRQTLQEVPREQQTMARVAQLHSQHLSWKKIAAMLNREHRFTRSGRCWQYNQLESAFERFTITWDWLKLHCSQDALDPAAGSDMIKDTDPITLDAKECT